MKRFILISPKNRTAYNFRGDLIRDIIAKGYDVIVTGPNQDNVEKIKELGARFIEIPMNKNGINPFSDILYAYHLYKIMAHEHIDISLGYTIKPVIYGSIAAKLAKVRCINAMITGAGYLFAHHGIKTSIIRAISFLLYRLGLGAANHIIFQNTDDLNEFVKHKLCNKNKCSIVNGSGVNMQKFTPSPYPITPTFFMLGRMIHSKGVIDFLQAAAIVKKKYPNTRFMILGKIEESMQDAIKKEDIEPYVSAGIVEHFPETDNIALYYAQCSVFVLPTAYREGTPRVILEAMASARPIITTKTPGCKETVKEGINGFFVPIHDDKALANRMIFFIENSSYIPKMGAASLDLCRNKYEISIINRKMLSIMEIDKK